MKKKRKTRVTKEMVNQVKEDNKIKAKKNVVIPGPWTNTKTDFDIKEPQLRLTKGIAYDVYGAYTDDEFWKEKGWYPIVINITSPDIFEQSQKHGLDLYVAAWEKSINTEENKKLYGTLVILEASIDHSLDKDETHRFVSCRAKTNRKSIKGFSAIRQGKYIILE